MYWSGLLLLTLFFVRTKYYFRKNIELNRLYFLDIKYPKLVHFEYAETIFQKGFFEVEADLEHVLICIF